MPEAGSAHRGLRLIGVDEGIGITGLHPDELAQHNGEPLPPREQMSLLTTGALGTGLVDAGATPSTDGGADADGSTDPGAHTSAASDLGAGAPYVEDAQQTRGDLAQTPSQNDGAYSAEQTASSTTE